MTRSKSTPPATLNHVASHSFPLPGKTQLWELDVHKKLINEELKHCDYAVFACCMRTGWGSPTGAGHSSGTEEEWKLAEELYTQTKIRNIALFFKEVAPAQLKDPGPQLAKVIEFKRKIENGKKYLFKSYTETSTFGDKLNETGELVTRS